jgi:hypothetical protein
MGENICCFQRGKNACPEGVQVSSRGVNYTDCFAFQRGKNPQKQRSLTRGLVFKCYSLEQNLAAIKNPQSVILKNGTLVSKAYDFLNL